MKFKNLSTTVFLAASLATLSGCDLEGFTAAAPDAAASATAADPAPSLDDETLAAISWPMKEARSAAAQGPLRNEHGIRRKAIITRPGVRCLDEPESGLPVGDALPCFRPHFVFAVHPAEGKPTWLRIGKSPSAESIIGWASVEDAAPWDTRIGARHAVSTGGRTPPLLVYDNPQALKDLVIRGGTDCEPLARAVHDGRTRPMPWLVTGAETFEHLGKMHEIVHLEFLAETSAGETSPPGDGNHEAAYTVEEVAEIRHGARQLEIVFILDNTRSTAPFVNAMREAVRSIARQLAEMPGDLKLAVGLALYRDFVDGLMFEEGGEPSATKVFWDGRLQTDLAEFDGVVATLETPDVSSDDCQEAVFDGIADAYNQIRWRPDRLSQRIFILIGDNSGHAATSARNPRGITIERMVEVLARPGQQVKLYSLCVRNRGDEAEQRLHWSQFRRLAEETGGVCHSLDEASKIVQAIEQAVEAEAEVVAQRAAVVDFLSDQAEPSGSTPIDVRDVTKVMTWLAERGIDGRRLSPGVPTFASGYCLTSLGGVPILEKQIYLARPEIDLLIAELQNLCVRLSPKAARDTFRIGVNGRLGAIFGDQTFFSEQRDDRLDVYLQAKGIPSRTGVLALSQSDVESMSESSRNRLRQRIAGQVIPRLINCRNDNRYFTYAEELEFGWIPESALP